GFRGAAGGAALTSLLVAPGPRGMLGGGLAVLMCAIAVYDARHFVIPNALNALALGLALIHAAVAEPRAAAAAVGMALARGALSAAVLLAIKLAYQRLRGRHGIGMGDGKLAGVAGACLDWIAILSAVELAGVAALSTYLIYRMLSGRPLRATNALPFGLYFAPAIWVGWLLDILLFAF